ncbi:leucyl aminopeptidase family protein [Siculibacillus lacustris]|uniref:Leucyl aminopeptidase family protein n=1 Tax=Siculibacillus lacustris TaxID=1549641 RepID=A0A4Q9VTA0_9HYPH|nr:leucyl aminopeptidase family protein [Siculibacillus lacustris]
MPFLPLDFDLTSLPVWTVTPEGLAARLDELGGSVAAFARACGFEATAGALIVVPDAEGGIAGALFGLGRRGDPARTPFLPGRLATLLPPGDWHIDGPLEDETLAALAFGLEAYRFGRYRDAPQRAVRLRLPISVDRNRLGATIEAVWLARDLINTPANDLGPAELANAIQAVFMAAGGQVREIVGDDLRDGFPLVHAVGHGSDRAPRLIDATWGRTDRPKVTLVGKGVVFDSGGLDIKSDAGMLLMKKDMGGAASALALAAMILAADLPVRLRLIVPAVENAVSGRAYRPGDVVASRKGPTVEIGNTDAEGRLVLADALALADEEAPALLIDLATLTGAARVALGPDLPPFYTADDELAQAIAEASVRVFDPLWRMPLWPAYRSMLDSKIADTNNVATGGFAGSILAALFLQRFVEAAESWVHVDVYGWTPAARPGRPEGGEAQAIRALFEVIAARHPKPAGVPTEPLPDAV